MRPTADLQPGKDQGSIGSTIISSPTLMGRSPRGSGYRPSRRRFDSYSALPYISITLPSVQPPGGFGGHGCPPASLAGRILPCEPSFPTSVVSESASRQSVSICQTSASPAALKNAALLEKRGWLKRAGLGDGQSHFGDLLPASS